VSASKHPVHTPCISRNTLCTLPLAQHQSVHTPAALSTNLPMLHVSVCQYVRISGCQYVSTDLPTLGVSGLRFRGLRVRGFGPRFRGFGPRFRGFRPRFRGFRPRCRGVRAAISGFQVAISGVRVAISAVRAPCSWRAVITARDGPAVAVEEAHHKLAQRRLKRDLVAGKEVD